MKKEDLSGKYVLVDKGATVLVFDFKTQKAVNMKREAVLDDMSIKNYILDRKTGRVLWSNNVQFMTNPNARLIDLHFLCLDHCGRQKYVMYCYCFSTGTIKAFKYPEAYLENKFSIFVDNATLKDMQSVLDANVIVYTRYKEISDILCEQELEFDTWTVELEELIGNYLNDIAPRRMKPVQLNRNGVVLAVSPKFADGCRTRADIVAKLNKEIGVGENWPDDWKCTDFVDELMTITKA